MTGLAKASGWLLGAIVAMLIAGALVPRNIGWREADAGVEIGLEWTLAHTELVLPVVAAGHDWRAVLGPVVVPPDVAWISLSWGERDFFLNTPDWADLDPRLAIRALFASEASLLHVYRLDHPVGRRIMLNPEEYRRLADWLAAEVQPGGNVLAGYGPEDVFVDGVRRYGWWRTCNQWVADALAHAGVRSSAFTPLVQGLSWRFGGRARMEEERA